MNKFLEAEKALLTEKNLKKNIVSKDVENSIPNGAAGFYLLGIICEKLVRVYLFNFFSKLNQNFLSKIIIMNNILKIIRIDQMKLINYIKNL